MNKELTPLEAFGIIKYSGNESDLFQYNKLYDIIEDALIKLENYEQNEDFNKDVLNYAFLNEQDKIKKLKALEIIKKKKINFDYIEYCDTYEQYRTLCRYYYHWPNLTQDEFDLLREVLK